jgi:hypothetical protein
VRITRKKKHVFTRHDEFTTKKLDYILFALRASSRLVLLFVITLTENKYWGSILSIEISILRIQVVILSIASQYWWILEYWWRLSIDEYWVLTVTIGEYWVLETGIDQYSSIRNSQVLINTECWQLLYEIQDFFLEHSTIEKHKYYR